MRKAIRKSPGLGGAEEVVCPPKRRSSPGRGGLTAPWGRRPGCPRLPAAGRGGTTRRARRWSGWPRRPGGVGLERALGGRPPFVGQALQLLHAEGVGLEVLPGCACQRRERSSTAPSRAAGLAPRGGRRRGSGRTSRAISTARRAPSLRKQRALPCPSARGDGQRGPSPVAGHQRRASWFGSPRRRAAPRTLVPTTRQRGPRAPSGPAPAQRSLAARPGGRGGGQGAEGRPGPPDSQTSAGVPVLPAPAPALAVPASTGAGAPASRKRSALNGATLRRELRPPLVEAPKARPQRSGRGSAGHLAGRGRRRLQHGGRDPPDVAHQGLGVVGLQGVDLRVGDGRAHDLQVGVVPDGDGHPHGLLAPGLAQGSSTPCRSRPWAARPR